MNIKTIISIVTFLCFLGILGCQRTNTPKPTLSIHSVDSLILSGEYQKVTSFFRMGEPLNNQQYSRLAKALLGIDSIHAALDIQKRVVEQENASSAYDFLLLGECFFALKQLDSAEYWFNKCQQIPILNSDDSLKINLHFGLLNTAKLDTAKTSFYTNLVQQQIRSKAFDSLALADAARRLSEFYLTTDKLDSALYYANMSQHILESISDTCPILGHTYATLGVIYSQKNDFQQSLYYFEKAKVLIPKLNSAYYQYHLYRSIGDSYMENSDSQNAAYYYNEALNYLQKIELKGLFQNEKWAVVSDLINANLECNDYERIKTLIQQYPIAFIPDSTELEVVTLCKSIGLYYMNCDSNKLAQVYFEKSQAIYKKTGQSLSRISYNLGYCMLMQSKKSQALEQFNTIINNVSSNWRDKYVYLGWKGIAEVYEKDVETYSQAIEAYDKALQTLVSQGNTIILDSFKILLAKGRVQRKQKVFKNALQTFDEAISLQTRFHTQFLSESGLLIWYDNLSRAYSAASECAIQMSYTDEAYKSLAFQYLDNGKALFLKKYLNNRTKGGDNNIKTEDIQQKLKHNQILLSYLFDDKQFDSIYIFILKKDALTINVSNIVDTDTPLSKQIIKFRDEFLRQQKPFQSEDSYSNFINQNFWISRKVLSDAIIFENSDELIIIPDGFLWALPFECLLRKRPPFHEKFSNNYLKGCYLINTHAVWYAFSAKLYIKNLDEDSLNDNINMSLLAVAPKIDGKYCTSKALNQNQKEAETICEKLNGRFLTGDEANRNLIENMVDRYSILHFSTHGINDNDLRFSHLVLRSDETICDSLTAQQISHLNIPAKLVTLSACETAIGRFLYRGEGIISLGRSFFAAGTQSIVSTLWSVEENSTQFIFENFYENLKNGLSKSKALQKAKIAAINNNFDTPQYWAGIVGYGNSEALFPQKNLNTLKITEDRFLFKCFVIIFLFFLILLVYFWVKRKGSNRS